MRSRGVLTGAGMSAESGLSTFRDSGGLWEQHSIEDVATPEGWAKNPDLVLRFYNERRKQALEAIQSKGHKILASLQKNFHIDITLSVYPAAGLLNFVNPDVEIFLIDPVKPINNQLKKVYFIGKKAVNGLLYFKKSFLGELIE